MPPPMQERSELSTSLDELRKLSDRSKIVMQHIASAMPEKSAKHSVGRASLSYVRPSLGRAAELDGAVGELRIALGTLKHTMSAANAAATKVQGLEQRLKRATAGQLAMDITGSDRRELRRRGPDLAVGGGALERPQTALGLMRPGSAAVWGQRPQSVAGLGGGRQSPLPGRPATGQGYANPPSPRPGTAAGERQVSRVREDKSFMSIMGDEPSREVVQHSAESRKATRSRLSGRPPNSGYKFQNPGVGSGTKRTVKPIVTARQLARLGEWGELMVLLSGVEPLDHLAGNGPGSSATLGELYQLRGQAGVRTAGGAADAYVLAMSDLNTALTKAPWQPVAFYWRGVTQLRLAAPSHEAVLRDMEACLQLQDPTEACAEFRLARAQLTLKQYNLAVAAASRALQTLDCTGGAQPPTESEVIHGLRSEVLLCRGLATLHAGGGKPTAAATMDFAAVVTDDDGFAARWLSDTSLGFDSVKELWLAFPEDGFVSQRCAQSLMAAGDASAAVSELGKLLYLKSEAAALLRRWALSERLRLMALDLSPPSTLALGMMADDRRELVEWSSPEDTDDVALAAEVHLGRAYARATPAPWMPEALETWDCAKALPSATYAKVAALDTAGTPDYLLGRLAWGQGAVQDQAAGKDARAHFLKAWAAGYRYTLASTPEILGCLAAASLLASPAPAPAEGDVAPLASLASLAMMAAVRSVSGGNGLPNATSEDSLHLALLLITSPTVSAAEVFAAVPATVQKKWTPVEKEASDTAQAAAEADIALVHQHLMKAGTTVATPHVPETNTTAPILKACLDQATKMGRLAPPAEGEAPSLTYARARARSLSLSLSASHPVEGRVLGDAVVVRRPPVPAPHEAHEDVGAVDLLQADARGLPRRRLLRGHPPTQVALVDHHLPRRAQLAEPREDAPRDQVALRVRVAERGGDEHAQHPPLLRARGPRGVRHGGCRLCSQRVEVFPNWFLKAEIN